MVALTEIKNMFWGVTLDGGKRYTQTVETSFHISMAALEVAQNKDQYKDAPFVSVMLQHDKAEFLLCTLEHNKVLQVPLDLNFTEGEEVTFFLNGKGVIHLTGYLCPEMTEDLEEDDSDDESDESYQVGEEDEDASDDSDEEEDSDDEVPRLLQFNEEEEESDEDEEEVEIQVKGKRKKQQELSNKKKKKKVEKEEDSDEEDDDDEDSDDWVDMEDEEFEDEEEGDSLLAEVEEGEEESDEEEEEQEEDIGASFIGKKDKKKKKSKEKDTPKKMEESPVANGETPSTDKKKKKKKKKNKNKDGEQQTQNGGAGDGVSPGSAKKDKQQNEAAKNKKGKKMVLAGGVIAEDVKEGHGPPAQPGKMVGVYYSGKLAKNGKQFDATLSGMPFRFKLGKQEVIKGWDIGVKGMKVGGKRKLTIPANMAYGSQRQGPIPPNSTLEFEVELKNVK